MTSKNDRWQARKEGQVQPEGLWHEPIETTVRRLVDNPAVLKDFFSLTGGSILYCLSALSILYGIAQIMTPLLARSSEFADALPCILVVNIYELALLVVLVTIVVWRDVTDDAISLVVLVGVFVVTSGTVLGAGAYHAPQLCIYIGLGCAALGVAKLYAMRRWVGFRIGGLSLVGMGVIFVWNFLGSSVLSGAFAMAPATGAVYRGLWQTVWLVLLAGGGLVVSEAVMSKPCREEEEYGGQRPFLHKPAMVRIFSLVVLGGAGVGQYGNAYMYAVRHVLGDYILLIGVVTILALELMRSLEQRSYGLHVTVACVPLACTLYAIAAKSIIASAAFDVQVFWYPPVMLGLVGAAILLLSIRHKWHHLSYVALVYGLGCLLTIGFSPDRPHELNWHLCGGGLVTALFILGVLHKNVVLCFAASVALAGALSTTEWFVRFAQAHELTKAGAALGAAGLGTLVVCMVFGRKVPRVITIFGAMSLMAFGFDYVDKSLGWRDMPVAAACAVTCAAFWLRTKEIAAMVIVCMPMAPRLYILAKKMSSWGFVVLSFVLLFMGAAVSLFGKRDRTLEGVAEEAPAGK